MNEFSLKERVAVITGGAGLLGREFAMALAGAGARVALADVDEARATAVAGEVKKETGGDVLALRVDVTDPESTRQMAQAVVGRFGALDVLVNNAAINPVPQPNPGGSVNAFETFPLDAWNRSLGVDLTGMALCAQAVSGPMLKQKRGVIINISSTYGLVGPDQRIYKKPGETHAFIKPVTYSVTKSAVLGLTRYLATYWAGKGIRVNALSPGGVFNGQDPHFVEEYSHRTPLGRMAEKSELRGPIVFLASDASSYMTGANLVVDGGWTAW